MGIVRRQKAQVYVQQSRTTTLPFKPLIERGGEFAQPVMSLNSGAGVAGITSISAFCKSEYRI